MYAYQTPKLVDTTTRLFASAPVDRTPDDIESIVHRLQSYAAQVAKNKAERDHIVNEKVELLRHLQSLTRPVRIEELKVHLAKYKKTKAAKLASGIRTIDKKDKRACVELRRQERKRIEDGQSIKYWPRKNVR